MSGPMSSSGRSRRQDIAPDGDVILIVGPGQGTRFRVYSQVLKSASQVFRAMLGSHFREGQQLAHEGSVEIPLPEDDPRAMEIILNVLHHNNSDFSSAGGGDGGGDAPSDSGDNGLDTRSAKRILNVAVAADKYGCKEALEFAFKHWIRTALASPSEYGTTTASNNMSSHELFNWLNAVYWLDDAGGFEQISLRLILNHHGSFTELLLPSSKQGQEDSSESGHDHDIGGHEEEQHLRIIHGLESQRDKLRRIMLTAALARPTVTPWMPCNCRFDAMYYFRWTETLYEGNFFDIIFTQSVEMVLGVAAGLPEPDEEVDGAIECPGHGNRVEATSSPARYNRIVESVRGNPVYKGLCLESIRSGSSTFGGGGGGGEK